MPLSLCRSGAGAAGISRQVELEPQVGWAPLSVLGCWPEDLVPLSAVFLEAAALLLNPLTTGAVRKVSSY
jgi:hypothetical protein